MQSPSRRQFLGKSAKASIAAIITYPSIVSFLESCSSSKKNSKSPSNIKTGFEQTPLPYAYAALEPWIDAQTMDIHYNKHAAAYCKNVKEAAAAESIDMTKPLEEVLYNISKYSVKMRNNAGGHYNHELFWKSLAPNTNTVPTGKLMTAIEKQFGSLDKFKAAFEDAAKTRFGSGWAWLIYTNEKTLAVTSTPNQDNPLMDIAETKGFPIFGLDVWEHAYYLKYQNRRADYVTNFWKILNWNYAQERFNNVG